MSQPGQEDEAFHAQTHPGTPEQSMVALLVVVVRGGSSMVVLALVVGQWQFKLGILDSIQIWYITQIEIDHRLLKSDLGDTFTPLFVHLILLH